MASDPRGQVCNTIWPPFTLKKCLLVLERLPKFNHLEKSPSANQAPSTDESAFSDVCSGLKRPAGTKKEKEKLKVARWRENNEEKWIDTVKGLVT